MIKNSQNQTQKIDSIESPEKVLYIISFDVFDWKGYEKVSDQGPVWVQSEEKILGGFISTHHINIWLPECSLVP